MNKLYSVHDHWTDINKKNDVDIESIDGVITGIKVNGEDYGGGSSDFSTAEVTINKGEMGATVNSIIPWFSEEYNNTNAFLTLDELTESWTVKVPVGGNFITVYFSRAPKSISGDIEAGSDTTILSKIFKSYVITGDCSISFT